MQREKQTDDLIYRQQVIDALDKEYRCTDKSDDWDGLETAMLIIENLPSVQPEIIHCGECKHWKQESICDGYCSEIEKDGFDEDHFCGYAERREK